VRRTNIVLDDSLIGKAKRLTGLKTMKEVINFALKELVRHNSQQDILKLKFFQMP
jgi:Arc/MetJ family transcription regulator